MIPIISYAPLFKTIEKRDSSQYKLVDRDHIIGHATLDSIKKGKYITLRTVEKLCLYFNCQSSEIYEIVPDNTDFAIMPKETEEPPLIIEMDRDKGERKE